MKMSSTAKHCWDSRRADAQIAPRALLVVGRWLRRKETSRSRWALPRWGPAARRCLAAEARRRQARLGPLADEVALKLRQRPEDVEDELTARHHDHRQRVAGAGDRPDKYGERSNERCQQHPASPPAIQSGPIRSDDIQSADSSADPPHGQLARRRADREGRPCQGARWRQRHAGLEPDR